MGRHNTSAGVNVQALDNVKVLVLGDPEAGKTSFVKSFCTGAELLKTYDPTVGVEFHTRHFSHNFRPLRLNIWDVSGLQQYSDVRNEFYKEADAVIIVFDVTVRKSFDSLSTWLDEVQR